jgi:DNA-binding transcriptional LysR family regulator
MAMRDSLRFESDMASVMPAGLDVLLCVARRGSATRAARELQTTPARVLRRLSALEESLGATLFDRTPGGLVPTPALELVLPWAEQAASAVAQMRSELVGLERAPVGTVHLALFPGLPGFLVTRGLDQFLEQHPGLSLEFEPASAIVDLTRREADIAIRTVRSTTGDLVVQRLATFSLQVMAAPALANRPGVQGLGDLPWVAFSESLAATPDSTWLREHVPEARVVLRAPDLQVLLNAAQAGIGAIVVGEPLGRLAGLVPIPTPQAMPEGTLWLVAHRGLRPVPRVDAVWKWLLSAFKTNDAVAVRAPSHDGGPAHLALAVSQTDALLLADRRDGGVAADSGPDQCARRR